MNILNYFECAKIEVNLPTFSELAAELLADTLEGYRDAWLTAYKEIDEDESETLMPLEVVEEALNEMAYEYCVYTWECQIMAMFHDVEMLDLLDGIYGKGEIALMLLNEPHTLVNQAIYCTAVEIIKKYAANDTITLKSLELRIKNNKAQDAPRYKRQNVKGGK